MGEAVIVAGVGCRKGAAIADVQAAVLAALAQCGVPANALAAIATSAAKSTEAGIAGAALQLGVPLLPVSQTDLEVAAPGTRTRSERVLALLGLPSLAEAAALAAAGPTARLLVSRIAKGSVTCALAETGELPEKQP
ncbi:MAG TPA: cobalamin biosynthesis protein [Xanthobacteraceae bacterium]|jgi:cobalt-precorrin 5A hydrolase